MTAFFGKERVIFWSVQLPCNDEHNTCGGLNVIGAARQLMTTCRSYFDNDESGSEFANNCLRSLFSSLCAFSTAGRWSVGTEMSAFVSVSNEIKIRVPSKLTKPSVLHGSYLVPHLSRKYETPTSLSVDHCKSLYWLNTHSNHRHYIP